MGKCRTLLLHSWALLSCLAVLTLGQTSNLLLGQTGSVQTSLPRNVVNSATATSQASDLTDAVDAVAAAAMQDQKLVGLAIALIQDGEVSYVQGYGLEDREAGVPVSEETMFRWASISKPVTAVLAMQLVDDAKLDLDANVRTLVPEFPEQSYNGEQVTVTSRQLLCHQGGIVHYTNGPVIVTPREYESEHPFEDVVLALDKFRESPLVNAPGEAFSYTTHGYMLLGAAVQRAGNEKFADQAKSRVFDPLGMATMQPDYQWIEIPHRAVGYRLRRGEPVRSTNTDVSWKLAGGGFISTVGDLARFGAGLMSEKLLPEETREKMWTRQQTASGETTGYGLGFNVARFNQQRQVGHTGAQEKTRTALFLLPDSKLGVAIMTNSENANLRPVANEILQLLVDEQ